MGKGHAAGVQTAADSDYQKQCWAVKLGLASTLRLNDSGSDITVVADSSATYSRWDLKVSNIVNSGSIVESLTISFFNANLGSLYSNKTFTQIVNSEAVKDIDVVLYRIDVNTGGTQYETKYFEGKLDIDTEGVRWDIQCKTSTLGDRPGTNINNGDECRFSRSGFKGTDCGHTGSESTCLFTIAECQKKVHAVVRVTGSDPDGLPVAGGSFTAAVSAGPSTFLIEVDATGTPDTFQWNKDGGAYTTGVAMTGAAQTLSDGVTVTWGATTGHTIGDEWSILASNVARFGGFPHTPIDGTVVTINQVDRQVPGGYARFHYRERGWTTDDAQGLFGGSGSTGTGSTGGGGTHGGGRRHYV